MCKKWLTISSTLLIVLLLPVRLTAAEEAVLSIGTLVPNVNANDHNGELWRLTDHTGQGKYLVVYFYPAAMTGGCTKQACAYRDNTTQLRELGIDVVGVSADAVRNLQAFRQAENNTANSIDPAQKGYIEDILDNYT